MRGSKNYFSLLAQHCDKISERIENVTYDDWMQNDTLQDAVCMRLMALAECVKVCLKENPSLSNEYPHIPWNRIVRFRDKIAHHYEGVDFDVVWEFLGSDIQPLHEVAAKLATEPKFPSMEFSR